MTDIDWPYSTHDPDAISGEYGGDICPQCGDPLRGDEVVIHANTRNRGTVLELAPDDVTKPLLHLGCWKDVQTSVRESEHKSLEEYA